MWISVKDKLPELENEVDSINVIVKVENKDMTLAVAWYIYSNKTWNFTHYKAGCEPIKVTHWKKLPKSIR